MLLPSRRLGGLIRVTMAAVRFVDIPVMMLPLDEDRVRQSNDGLRLRPLHLNSLLLG
jgi:hypothetical protein